MKIQLITSIVGIEAANCILRIGIEALQQNEELMKDNGVEHIDIYEAIQFRKKLVKAVVRTKEQSNKKKSK